MNTVKNVDLRLRKYFNGGLDMKESDFIIKELNKNLADRLFGIARWDDPCDIVEEVLSAIAETNGVTLNEVENSIVTDEKGRIQVVETLMATFKPNKITIKGGLKI